MHYQSVLFEKGAADINTTSPDPPPFLSDLNIDQIVDALTKGREDYDLAPFFLHPLHGEAEITYRHEVFRDLEDADLRRAIYDFAQGMRSMRSELARSESLHYPHQKERRLLRAIGSYCATVAALTERLNNIEPDSRALSGIRKYLSSYTASDAFRRTTDEAESLERELSSLRYSLLIKGSSVTVRSFASERDYAAEVHRTFERFCQGAAKDYSVEFEEWADMNHVEAAVLDRVAMLHPELFRRLEELWKSSAGFVDGVIEEFDREIQFYLAYHEMAASLGARGLRFCLPAVEETGTEVFSVAGFDLALALKLNEDHRAVVTNDFELHGPERVIIVSGPNQGGKTTFARALGQLHYLAALGCPVPGRQAGLALFDRLLTHFEREEEITNLRGKLHDDLERMHEILNQAGPRSVVILNEVFNSTTLSDEIFLSRRVLEKVLEKDCLCVCVTFIEELASYSERTVSMVSTVDPENPAARTFKIVRRPADGLAYAIAIAKKHRLTYEELRRRVTR